jgi:hypothetical protein
VNSPATDLLEAFEKRDATRFTEISNQIQASSTERHHAACELLEVIRGPDLTRAKLALDAMGIAGLVLHEGNYLQLVGLAEERFPSAQLEEMASEEIIRERERLRRAGADMGFLKSIIMVMLRRERGPGAAFVALVEDKFRGTALPGWISSIRRVTEDGPPE